MAACASSYSKSLGSLLAPAPSGGRGAATCTSSAECRRRHMAHCPSPGQAPQPLATESARGLAARPPPWHGRKKGWWGSGSGRRTVVVVMTWNVENFFRPLAGDDPAAYKDKI